MDKYFASQPFGSPTSLADELAHDPGNSSHWTVSHSGYALPGAVDAAVYQSAQLAYPESSQRTIVPPNAYNLYYDQVRANQQLSAQPQLPRETYELGQSYYPYPYDYSALQSFTGTGPYESADAASRDDDTQSTHSPPSQQAIMPPGYVTSHCTHTSVGSDDLCPDSLFLDSRRDTQPGSSSDSAKDGSDDDGYSAQRTPSPVPRTTSGQKRGGRITLKKTNPSSKRSKMHQCTVCEKWFPRPSGLATHMNSHSGMKPYRCPVESCNKSFAVRSNAKRHLRTHGINPATETTSKALEYTVGFETPMVSDVRPANQVPVMLKWVPQSLTSRTTIGWNDKSSDSGSDGEDNFPTLSVPLSPATSSSMAWDCGYSSGESYEAGDSHPYHPRHWRGLPGPARR